MKGYSIFISLLFAMIIVLSTFSCSPTGTSEVTIRINLGLHNQNAFNIHEDSIIDRIFRFFTKDAEAQAAPEGITAIGLNIAREGMSAINESYSADTSVITINVPAGPARVFQVTAYRLVGNYGGSSEPYDLEAGQSMEIPITMAEQYSSVTINPAYPDGTPASTTLTYTVNVTTSGQTALSSSFTPGTALQVPAGASKDFEVLVSTPSVTFRGTVLGQNLTAGSSVTLPVNMTLYETKIIIPDPQNSRLIQIDDMSGNGWIEKLYSNFTPVLSSFSPYDIDFDSQGRIYIINYYYDGPDIIRIDDIDISSTPQTGIATIGGAEGRAIAIDRMNNLIYYCSYSTLYRCNLDGTNPVNLSSTTSLSGLSLTYFKGLSVDNSGNLYIACNIGASPLIVKYYPDTDTNSQYTTNLLNCWDVIVKNNYLYIADYDPSTPSDSSKIIQLSLDLNYINQLGTTDSGTFHGPHRFLAILNSRFYLIDEDENATTGPPYYETERIIAFDNLSSSIDAFDPSMIGQSAFQFYSGS